jgi:WD40 repeat protein/mono/diheme cytochrome c family protein
MATLAVSMLLAWPGPARSADEPATTTKVSYYKDIRPIFQEHCQGCHQPAKPMGGLTMTSFEGLKKGGESEEPGFVPGKPNDSSLVVQITSQGGDPPAMPKDKPALTEPQVKLITQWIAEGAADDTPPMAREAIDKDHPPTYTLAPVLTSLDYSPDGKLIAVSGYHEVLLHHADGSGIAGRLVGLAERIESAVFSPDGKRLAVTGGSPGRFGEVQIWDVETQQLKLSLSVTFDTIYGANWSHDGKLVSFGCGDNTLRAIDAETGKQVLYQGAHSDWVLDTVFSTDSSHLISVSRDRSMKLTDVPTQRFEDNITSITPGALKGGLISVDRHPTKDEVVVGGADGVPKIYRIYREQGKDRKIGDDFNLIRNFDALPGRVFSVQYNADGSRVVAGSSKDNRGEVRVYQADDGKLVSKIDLPASAVYAVAFSPDGQRVAVAGFDGVVRLHDAASGAAIKEFTAVPLAASVASKD